MRNPLRTEGEAFSFVLVVGALFLAVGLAAAVGGSDVALGVFLGLVVGVAAGVYLRSEPRVREPAVWERGASRGRRVLVVAGAALVSPALLDEVVGRAGETDDVRVLALAGAPPERLEAFVAALTEAGVPARGAAADGEPLAGVERALSGFDADEVVVATPPRSVSGSEQDLLEALRERYRGLLTQVVVNG